MGGSLPPTFLFFHTAIDTIMVRLSRDEKRLITQEKIRNAALKEFASYGFSGAAIDRISEQAGFSRGAFYSNYQDKEAILLDLLRDHHRRNIAKWQVYSNDAKNINHVYKQMEKKFSDYLQEIDWGLFNIEVLLQAKRNKEFSAQYIIFVNEVHQNIEKSLGAMFTKAQKATPTNLQSLASIIHNLVIGIILDTHNDNSAIELKRCSKQLIICIRSFIDSASPLSTEH